MDSHKIIKKVFVKKKNYISNFIHHILHMVMVKTIDIHTLLLKNHNLSLHFVNCEMERVGSTCF